MTHDYHTQSELPVRCTATRTLASTRDPFVEYTFMRVCVCACIFVCSHLGIHVYAYVCAQCTCHVSVRTSVYVANVSENVRVCVFILCKQQTVIFLQICFRVG